MKQPVVITLTNQTKEIRKLVPLVKAFTETYRLSSDIEYDSNLVLEELLVSIMSHAYTDSDPHEIHVRLEQERKGEATFQVTYEGSSFNPFDIAYTHPENLSLDEIEDIFLSVHLIRELTDAHVYEAKDGKQILTLKLFDLPERKTIQSVMNEDRVFHPPAEFSAQAYVSSMEEYKKLYKESIVDPNSFWAKKAEELEWFKKWDTVCEENFAEAEHKWFVGGKLNVSYNCLDRNLTNGRKDKVALMWEGDDAVEKQTLTYAQLHRQVCRFSNVLRKRGVKKGDRVTIYLPMILELPIAMLACARIGAVHNIVFGGFSAEALKDRMIDCDSTALICADGYYRSGKTINSKQNADLAVAEVSIVKTMFVVRRAKLDVPMIAGRDYWWDDEMQATDISDVCEPEVLDAEDPLFILYTSGSTGKPKGVLHTQAGYLLYANQTFKHIFDIKEDDVYWCTADIGWITGHSYIIYGPLSNGATSFMFEGVPTYPEPDRFWDIVERYKVSIFYTAPTALRALMKEGDTWITRHDTGSLRLLGTVGEAINPEVWVWYHDVIGGGRCPIVDTWWQTETGGIMISPMPGAIPTKPGSATLPFFGIELAVVKEDFSEAAPNEGGSLIIKKPWPGLMRRVYGNPERFKKTYFSQFKGVYTTGDSARIDEDGYVWLMGRLDDVINVSGHRFGTAEIESALVSHPSVAEAAVVGISHEIKGQAIYAFVTLKSDIEEGDALVDVLRKHVRTKIGPIASPENIQFSDTLPKTRSGKIMRRILAKIAEGNIEQVEQMGDTSTLLDPSVVERLIKNRIKTGPSSS